MVDNLLAPFQAREWLKLKKFCFVFFILTLASIGFPSTNGFIGEFTILVGSFQTVAPFAVLSALGLILSAVYMLRIKESFFWCCSRNFFLQKKRFKFNRIFYFITFFDSYILDWYLPKIFFSMV